MATVLATIKREKLPAIIQESYYPQKTSQTIGQLGKAQVVVIAAGTRENQTYLDQIRRTTNAIFAALQPKETP